MLKDFLTPAVSEFQIELGTLLSPRKEDSALSSTIKITLFKFGEDQTRRNSAPLRPFGTPLQKKPYYNLEVIISAPTSPYELALDAVEKMHVKIQEKSFFSIGEYTCAISAKELTFEQSVQLYGFRGTFFPYLFLEIKLSPLQI